MDKKAVGATVIGVGIILVLSAPLAKEDVTQFVIGALACVCGIAMHWGELQEET